MEIKDFIQKFADQFEDTDASLFTETTDFRELDEWTSIIGLSVILMIDEEYGVTIEASDVQKSRTVKDLFDIVKSKM